MDAISEGDLVRLKCGGPDMTVVAMTSVYNFGNEVATPGAYCVYENRQFVFEQAYPLHSLEVIRSERRRSPMQTNHYL